MLRAKTKQDMSSDEVWRRRCSYGKGTLSQEMREQTIYIFGGRALQRQSIMCKDPEVGMCSKCRRESDISMVRAERARERVREMKPETCR